jgi:subtilisin family serine protease
MILKQLLKHLNTLFILCLMSPIILFGQVTDVNKLDQKYLNWYLKDFEQDQVPGTSASKAYEFLARKSVSKTIIVAVIDSGVAIDHEDLEGKIWINEDEVAGNYIDDDNNGYVDDVHGWNFIGNSKGENIIWENLEYVRIIKAGDKTDPLYAKSMEFYNENIAEKTEDKQNLERFELILTKVKQIIKDDSGIEVNSAEDLDLVHPKSDQAKAATKFLVEKYKLGFTEEALTEFIDYTNEYLNYMLNLDFNPRDIIGDDTKDITDIGYGNPDVTGPRADHGTGVSGVIAAVRGNGIGIEGIATNVKIMAIRAVPNGDERDKDIALAIRYAVDNGANIINMSFGKDFSPEKEYVDEAVRYAADNNVLLVHAAGNDGKNIDLGENYPTKRMLDETIAPNYLSVGASTSKLDKTIAASFSNYSSNYVDLFAPGEHIITLDTGNQYNDVDGTSFAAPAASGVAALVWSYYPELTAVELKHILMASAFMFKKPKKVLLPEEKSDKRRKTKFTNLSKTGGLINAYEAVKLAEERSPHTASVNE